jgi:predicted ATPase/class 3 adenylate cyclase
MECPQCGASNPEGQKSCSDCGAALSKRCPSCGSESASGKKFCGDCGAALLGPPKPLHRPRPPIPESEHLTTAGAERRQVTVMFCDLVGSTALSASMDPEDLREIISAYQACVAETVSRYGGFVAKYMGDGALVYFGYPRADEHDAERAVRAALALIAAVSALNSPAPLQTRVGIATGVVVVGDLIGSGEAQERSIVGETPNLAARLQAMAEPNAVVTSESTRRIVGDLFEYRDLGTVKLKGFPQPIRAIQVVGESAVDSRFDALHAHAGIDLVGRTHETELLLRCWRQAAAGEGQLVLISGEPGIGKSRLADAVIERIAAEPNTRLRYFCAPHRADSAFYPLVRQLERAAGFKPDDSPESRLDKLKALLAETSTVAEDVEILTDFLSLPRNTTIELPPPERRKKTIDVITRRIEALARQQPALAVFEDVHWIDPTSLDVLSRIVDRIRDLAVLLLVTFRPEFKPPWAGQSHVTELVLNRLGPSECVDLVRRIVNNVLPEEVVKEIVARTDGVPLFVEELSRAVIEAGSGDRATKLVTTIPVSALAVPATLHASLMARLDRLGPAKEVAQLAAAIGREFSYELLAAVGRGDEGVLRPALERLVSAGLLFCQGAPPHATYLFKHALVQDAAYGTLLRGPRRELHARIARALIENFPQTAERSPEIVAHHQTEAGLVEQAAGFWSKAGKKSIAQSALVEAVAHLTKALGQIGTLPPTPAIRREQINLQVALAGALLHVKGYGSSETSDAFDQANRFIEYAETLGERSDDQLLPFTVLYGQWTTNFNTGHFDKMSEIARNFLALAEKQEASAPLIMGHRVMSGTSYFAGEFEAAKGHLDRAIALYRPEDHRHLVTRFGQDLLVAALCYRTIPLYCLGYPDSARRDADQALRHARELDHAASLTYAAFFAAHLEVRCSMVAEATTRVEELLSLSDRHGLLQWKVLGLMLQGWILIRTGMVEEAAKLLDSTVSTVLSSGAIWAASLNLMWLAQAHARCGRIAEARNCISAAIEAVEKTNQRWDVTELYRMAGQIELQASNREAAERQFQWSLSVARRQNEKWAALRTATGLARLWRDEGKCGEALELLAPLYNWFTEGFDTPVLQGAKSLLDQLA